MIYIVKHELRGIELVRTIIFKLVAAVDFFKGIFLNSQFDKNYKTSNMFCFISDITTELLYTAPKKH